MRGLRTFAALLRIEWREVRALTLACLLLVPAALVAMEYGFRDWRGDFAGTVFVPGVVLLYLAAISADAVAADVSTGRAKVYAALPVRLTTRWLAKIVFIVAAGAAFTAWTVGVTTALYATFAPTEQFGVLVDEITTFPAIALWAAVAVVAATILWSTVLERGLAAVGAAIVTCAVLGGTAPLVAWIDVELLPTKENVEWALALLPIVLLAASLCAYVRGPVHAASLLRRATLALGLLAAVLVPAGAAWASVLADRLDVHPGDPDVRVTVATVSPDRRHAVVYARKEHPHAVHRIWLLALEDGRVTPLDGKDQHLEYARPWTTDGHLLLWGGHDDPNTRREVDATTGQIVETRSYEQLQAAGEEPCSATPWARVSHRGTTTMFDTRDGLHAEVPGIVHAGHRPDTAWRRDGDAVLLHDLRTGDVRRVDLDLRPESVRESPTGDYLCASKGSQSRIIDVGAGRIVARVAAWVGWFGGGSDDRFCGVWRSGAALRLLDVVEGTETDLPAEIRNVWSEFRPLDAATWLTVSEHDVIELLDRTNDTTRTLYDPNQETE